jgi:hypothetical protein
MERDPHLAAEFYAVLMGGTVDPGPPDPESPLGRLLESTRGRRPTPEDVTAALLDSTEWFRARGKAVLPDGTVEPL